MVATKGGDKVADPESDPAEIAQQIAADPQLRAKFFENAGRAVAEAVPAERPFGLGADRGTKSLRQQVLAKVPEAMAKKPEAASSAHAEAVMQQFFRAAIRNPELSFMSILGLSVATFAVGVALVVAGLVMASAGGDDTRNAIVAGVFGGSGVVGVLGSVYTLARRGVSVANCNHAQIRLVLSGFATELGHLRALDLDNADAVSTVNHQIDDAVSRAVDLIQTRVKVEVTEGAPRVNGQAGVPSGQKQGESEGHS